MTGDTLTKWMANS